MKKTTKKASPPKKPRKAKAATLPKAKASFPVIGIGASAGGLEAYEPFFKTIPENSGMAFVIITHLDKTHNSILPEIIKRYTKIPVQIIKNGLKLSPNTVYIIPPNKNVDVNNGHFQLKTQDNPHYINLPVNYFFKALAREYKENAIAVILSGLGMDGTLGIKYISEMDGLVLVQDPLSAKYDGMPLSAINTGLADYILPPERIVGQIIKCSQNDEINEKKGYNDLQKILIMLRSYSGHDFSSYKLNTIRRRIRRQMTSHHVATLGAYVTFLQNHTQEIGVLFDDILIGVTSFFRDADAFETVKEKIIAYLLRHKKQDMAFRVWVPGCSTGEEVYSLAIAIHECMDEINSYRPIHIFGTDIDLSALEKARVGLYPKSISEVVSAERLQRFFIEEKSGYKVKKEIRGMVVFGVHNLIKDTSFTKMDLISCRNLLIYFNSELQKRLFPIFHFSLKPRGMLFLGASETITGYTNLFNSINKKWRIFERKDANAASQILMNTAGTNNMPPIEQTTSLTENALNAKFNLNQMQAIKQFLIDNYLAHCIVINKHGDVLYTHGDIRSYLRLVPQYPSFNIFEAVLPQICPTLVSAIRKANAQHKTVTQRNLLVSSKPSLKVNLKVIPLTDIDHLHQFICIVFEKVDSRATQKKSKSKNKSVLLLEKMNFDLENKLQQAKESLQCTIEELQSSNEELQSTNEELQSTNEELETSKEEMQSLNEELVIVNTELQYRIDQFVLINDDMVNLFNSTGILAIFLDIKLRVKRFTPSVKAIVNLIQADIGRSINDFSIAIAYDHLIKDVEDVLNTLSRKNFEVQGKDGCWYQVQILPYKTTANVIDGVIIIFNDISAHKKAESELSKQIAKLKAELSRQK